MPKKPTEQFGHIAFGKDGSVKKVMNKLSDNKAEQENEVGKVFADRFFKRFNHQYEIEPCPENGHDFWLKTGNKKEIEVQATEVLSGDYLRKLSPDEYSNGTHQFTSVVYESPKHTFGVDFDAKDEIMLTRFKGKLAKNYSRQQIPLWLLIWTVSGHFFPFWNEGGQSRISNGVRKVREHAFENGTAPFDEIWFLNLNGGPDRIWPK